MSKTSKLTKGPKEDIRSYVINLVSLPVIIDKVYLYGSNANVQEFNPNADIDILVLFKKKTSLREAQLIRNILIVNKPQGSIYSFAVYESNVWAEMIKKRNRFALSVLSNIEELQEVIP